METAPTDPRVALVDVAMPREQWEHLIRAAERGAVVERIVEAIEAFDVSCPTATIEYRCGYEVSRDRIETMVDNIIDNAEVEPLAGEALKVVKALVRGVPSADL